MGGNVSPSRARSESVKHMRKLLRLVADDYPADVARPRSRHDCAAGPRPCPFVSCRHHLYLDVDERTGTVKINFPTREPWEIEETCSLDVAGAGPVTLDAAGALMNVTRERARQIESRGFARWRAELERRGVAADVVEHLRDLDSRPDPEERYDPPPPHPGERGGLNHLLRDIQRRAGYGSGTDERVIAAVGPGERTTPEVAARLGPRANRNIVGRHLRDLEKRGLVASRLERSGSASWRVWRRAPE